MNHESAGYVTDILVFFLLSVYIYSALPYLDPVWNRIKQYILLQSVVNVQASKACSHV